VDLYQSHAVLSHTRIGSVSLNLANISDSPTPRWFNLTKVKGSTSESRGMIQMAVYFVTKVRQHNAQHTFTHRREFAVLTVTLRLLPLFVSSPELLLPSGAVPPLRTRTCCAPSRTTKPLPSK
jgi:hypothetical protein